MSKSGFNANSEIQAHDNKIWWECLEMSCQLPHGQGLGFRGALAAVWLCQNQCWTYDSKTQKQSEKLYSGGSNTKQVRYSDVP